MGNRTYLSLSGIIFQDGFGHNIGFDPTIGLRAMITTQTNYSIFHGVVENIQKNHPDALYEGVMTDRWGPSEIVDFVVDDFGISFEKRYNKRNPIYYKFPVDNRTTPEEIWNGTYEGVDCGKGTAKLMINGLTEDFFSPKK